MNSVELNNFTEEQMVDDPKKCIPNKLPSLPEESVNNTSKLIASEISDLVDKTIINSQRETRAKIGMSKVKTLLLTPNIWLVQLIMMLVKKVTNRMKVVKQSLHMITGLYMNWQKKLLLQR